MKGTSDNKSEENRPPLKLNFKGGLFSSILLSDASLSIFGDRGRFHVLQGDYVLDPGGLCFGSRFCVGHFFPE